MATRAVNPEYKTTTDLMTRRGGIFWGLVLVIVGAIWFAANLLGIELNFNLLFPLVVVIAGLYLITTKAMR